MKVFIDTSAFYALACKSDQYHLQAKSVLEQLLQKNSELFTSNYVILETSALILNRLGLGALETFLEITRTAITVYWITLEVHEEGIRKLIHRAKKNLSLVDCTSFVIMKKEGIKSTFTFDPDFEKEGFDIVSNHSSN